MKKTGLRLLLFTMLITLTACSGGGGGTGESGENGGRKIVVVAVLSGSRFLDAAAQKFEDKHPDIDIEIKEYLSLPRPAEGQAMIAPSQTDIEKYVQTLTTQAIAGEGTDIISLSALPLDQFVAKNVLADLKARMEKDAAFDPSLYYNGILESMQHGDGLYALPIGFYLEGIISANSGLLKQANLSINDSTWTWDEFKDISKKLQEQVGSDYTAFANVWPFQLLYESVDANYEAFVQGKQANFDSDLFRSLMRQIKSMYDEGVLSATPTQEFSKTLFTSYALATPRSAVMEMAQPQAAFYRKPTVDGHAGGISVSPFNTFGLNSKSKVQDEAWEFLKFLLSEEMQSSPELEAYPMHKQAVENKLEEVRASLERGDLAGDVPDPEAFAKHSQMLKSMLEQAGTSRSSDIKIVTMLEEEFDSYMNGQKTEEEVSRLIQSRVSTYLNE
ncbi:ABC transporter substrate-binding protein [Paenibacillus macerans]|uniref:ABC transporter substrate-binding protein n=1 Tax=Paenibacillus macerans TaxID=44252 RepID=UPI003D3208E9